MTASLRLPPQIGHANAEQCLQQLQQQLAQLLADDASRQVELDAAALHQFDSSALAVLLALLRAAGQQRPCVLINPSERLVGLARLYGLDELFLNGLLAAGHGTHASAS